MIWLEGTEHILYIRSYVLNETLENHPIVEYLHFLYLQFTVHYISGCYDEWTENKEQADKGEEIVKQRWSLSWCIRRYSVGWVPFNNSMLGEKQDTFSLNDVMKNWKCTFYSHSCEALPSPYRVYNNCRPFVSQSFCLHAASLVALAIVYSNLYTDWFICYGKGMFGIAFAVHKAEMLCTGMPKFKNGRVQYFPTIPHPPTFAKIIWSKAVTMEEFWFCLVCCIVCIVPKFHIKNCLSERDV